MLTSETIGVEAVSPADRLSMLELMCAHYEHVDVAQFYEDLDSKDCVIILRHEDAVCGFSTQVLLTKTVSGHKVRVHFSGDTVIEKAHRNSFLLPLAWGRMMLAELHADPTVPLYWLLTSKGYKTYRYLSVFFRDYFPQPGRVLATRERQVLDAFAGHWVNGRLDREFWIVRAAANGQRLRAGVADISDAKLKNPDVAYFDKMNSGHAKGDELVCLARVSDENLNPFILKRLVNP